jgi:hypothetical protein
MEKTPLVVREGKAFQVDRSATEEGVNNRTPREDEHEQPPLETFLMTIDELVEAWLRSQELRSRAFPPK